MYPGWQGKTVRGNQAIRGGQLSMARLAGGGAEERVQLGAIRLTGEQLGINQAGRGVVRG